LSLLSTQTAAARNEACRSAAEHSKPPLGTNAHRPATVGTRCATAQSASRWPYPRWVV
jgi:hypothetical protein